MDDSDRQASGKMEPDEWTRQPQYQKSNLSAQAPPVPMMLGEHAILVSKTSDGSAVVSNFRFFVCESQSFINVPLMMIGELTVTEATKRLRIGCKDGTSYACTFATPEDFRQCSELLKEKLRIPRQLSDIFAYRFYIHAKKKEETGTTLTSLEKEQIELCQPVPKQTAYSFGKEVTRLGFDCNETKIWKMSHDNESYDLCPTYPKYHILPATVDSDKLKSSTDFRAGKRFPSVVWRDKSSGVVLIRSSQPLPSFLGLSYYSNEADVFLLDEIVKACNRDRQVLLASQNSAAAQAEVKMRDGELHGRPGMVDNSQQVSPTSVKKWQASRSSHNPSSPARHNLIVNGHKEHKGTASHVEPVAPNCQLAIVDCRSLAMVWGNSLKGGGTEDEHLYKCNIIHLDLANIHTVRDSFSKLRSVCHSYQDGSYYKVLSGSMWLNYISSMLKGANTVVKLMHVDKRPVLVHCSDGWDRTAQIVSLSELMMDPYYRTIEGFQVLVEREWLAFGHKFGERGGHDLTCSDQNQQSPIFLQFLDCVYQLTLQYPASFQFNEAYLVKLLRHSQACLFGTFLHNCDKERSKCLQEAASVWSLLKPDNPQFLNLLYKDSNQVLTARCGEHEVVLWTSVYMAAQSPSPHGSPKDFSAALAENEDGEDDPAATEGFSRSKSMDDLSKASVDCGRRNSDPNLAQTPESAVAGTSATIHDTSSSSAEILHISDSPPVCGFHSEENGSSSSNFEEVGASLSGKERRSAEDRLDSWSGSFESTSSSLDVDNVATRNSLNSYGKNGHVSTSDDDESISSNRVTARGSIKVERFSSCNEDTVTSANTIEPTAEHSVQSEHGNLEDIKQDIDCDSLCNGIEKTISKSSHSSSHSSPLEVGPISLLSERLARCPTSGKQPQVNGISSTASFHPLPRSPDLEQASSDDRKILALKQTQQVLMHKAYTSPNISGSRRDDLGESAQNSHLEMNGHSTPVADENSLSGNGSMNSMSTDTLVGDSEEVGSRLSPTKQVPVTIALDINIDAEQPVVKSPLASLPVSASSSGLRTGSPIGGATAPLPRRARTGSGASIDSSSSPCVCRGHWSDTGRLRHPSGGDASVHRWIGSSVSTSTTDISDSCIGKVSPPVMERQAGMRQLLDVDGLTLFVDQRHELLVDLVTEKDKKISSLESRLKQALEMIRATRTVQMSQQPAAPIDELLLTETEGGEYSSLGAVSNPASDASWEQVDGSEERIVPWMPDEAVTHCASCDGLFWIAQRKHHCRNCGKIFCYGCSNFMAPMPGIYHNKPQRVCGRCHSRLMQLSPGASCDGRIPTMVADG